MMGDDMVEIPATPWMHEKEISLFAKWLPHGGNALEFGCGGSTRFFFERGIFHLTSVEGDTVWGQSVLTDPFLSFFIHKERLQFILPKIGPVGKHSMPVGPPTPLWLKYHSAVWDIFDCNALDFILIDGRFRLACAIQSIVHCPQKPIVFIHDFWNRKEYHPILNFMDILDRIETSVVLKQKKRIHWRNLFLLLQKIQFDPI